MYNVLHRKTTNFHKVTTVDTINLQPGELIHIDFSFYNVTSICGFTSRLTVVCENTRMIWVCPTASKYALFSIVQFIMTIPKNEHQPCKRIRVGEDGDLAK